MQKTILIDYNSSWCFCGCLCKSPQVYSRYLLVTPTPNEVAHIAFLLLRSPTCHSRSLAWLWAISCFLSARFLAQWSHHDSDLSQKHNRANDWGWSMRLLLTKCHTVGSECPQFRLCFSGSVSVSLLSFPPYQLSTLKGMKQSCLVELKPSAHSYALNLANMQNEPLLLSHGHESHKKAFHQWTKSSCCHPAAAFSAWPLKQLVP